ncbi:MAG: hypothetical protein J5940_02710, partial [Clostridia bacterium]|nr:hypothetical protein [Clostridia bacterium]
TITYARYGESTAAESRSEESEQTEATNTEPKNTEKHTETEPEPVVDPDEIRFAGFSPLEEIVAPADINGLDLSTFAEGSTEYAVYSNVGRLAVISRELKLYEEGAEAQFEKLKTETPVDPYLDGQYMACTYKQCLDRAQTIRRNIRSLIYSFNVAEYEGTKSIEEKYSAEFLERKSAFRSGCTGIMQNMEYLFSDRSWQQDMLTTELKTLLDICGDLAGLKSSGVSYVGYIDDLIGSIVEAAEDLSKYCDSVIETMTDPVYPGEYRIERALYDDCIKLYIYVGDDTEYISFEEYWKDLPSGFKPSYDLLHTDYNEEERRYEIYLSYKYYFNSFYLFGLRNNETKLTRLYNMVHSPYMKNVTHTGDYTEEKLFESISPAIRDALITAYENDFFETYNKRDTEFDLLFFHFSRLTLLSDGEHNGISEIIISPGVNAEGQIIIADIKYDEPLLPLSFGEIKTIYEYSRIGRSSNMTLTADKGTLLLDYEQAGDLFEYTSLYLYGYNEEISRYKTELEEAEIELDDSLYLAYSHSASVYSLLSLDENGRPTATGLKFNLNFELVK